MRRAMMLMVVASLAASVGLVQGGDAKKDLDMMQGKWTIESIKVSQGKEPSAEELKAFLVTIKGDAMDVAVDGKTAVAFKLKLDAAKTPKTIDFEYTDGPDKGKSELGVYKLEGKDAMVYCVNDIGRDRPGAFATKEGTKIDLVTLKRAK